jgi:hypothetical protein
LPTLVFFATKDVCGPKKEPLKIHTIVFLQPTLVPQQIIQALRHELSMDLWCLPSFFFECMSNVVTVASSPLHQKIALVWLSLSHARGAPHLKTQSPKLSATFGASVSDSSDFHSLAGEPYLAALKQILQYTFMGLCILAY